MAKSLAQFIPYRNLNYKAQKFTMVSSSLDIHKINVMNLSDFEKVIKCMY